MTTRPHLLVVDDEDGIRESLSSILVDEGYHVEAVGSAEAALERAAAGDIEVVLLDVWLPGISGLETLKQMRESNSDAAVVIISGHGNVETAVRATKLGAFDFIASARSRLNPVRVRPLRSTRRSPSADSPAVLLHPCDSRSGFQDP